MIHLKSLVYCTWNVFNEHFNNEISNYHYEVMETSENINHNEFLPRRCTDLTWVKHNALNHESLEFSRRFQLSELGMDILGKQWNPLKKSWDHDLDHCELSHSMLQKWDLCSIWVKIHYYSYFHCFVFWKWVFSLLLHFF